MSKKKKKSSLEPTIEELEKSTRGSFIFEVIAVWVLGLLAGLYYAAAYSAVGKNGYSAMFDYISKYPFCFVQGIGKNISTPLGIMTIITLILFANYTYQKMRVHNDVNKLKGKTKWAKLDDIIEKYADIIKGKPNTFREVDTNYFLGDDVAVSINTKKHNHALNVLGLGTTGSGKSFGHIKPNILQMNGAYVVTDPAGDLTKELGETMRRFGYRVFVLDVNTMKGCNTYNPLKYCKTEADVKVVVDSFIESMDKTGGKGSANQDPFWNDSMNAYLCAVISLLALVPEGSDKPYGQMEEIMGEHVTPASFSALTELTRLTNSKWSKTCGIPLGKDYKGEEIKLSDNKNNSATASTMAAIYENIRAYESKRQNKPMDMIDKPYTLREWENFRIAPEKTSTTILMTVAVKLDAFNIEQVKQLMDTDTINLDDFGNQRDILFMIIPTQVRTYDFVAAFLYTQLFAQLYNRAESGLTDTKNLYVNGELLRHFTREEIAAGEDEAYLKKAKAATVEYKKVNGPIKIDNKTTFDDSYYELVAKDGTVITRRPDKALMDAYVAGLQKAELTPHYGKALPQQVKFLLDEFKNTGRIPGFLEKLATIRKYDITCTVILQNLSQLKGMYPDDWSTIDGNCPFFLFLGGDDNETTEYISKKIGNETVRGWNNSVDNKKVNMSYQVEGRELMRPEDIGRIDFFEEIVFIYGEQPIFGHKFNYNNHKRYKYTYEAAKMKGCIFDRTAYDELRTSVQPVKPLEKPTAEPNIRDFTPDVFKQIFAKNDVSENDFVDTLNALNENEDSFGIMDGFFNDTDSAVDFDE